MDLGLMNAAKEIIQIADVCPMVTDSSAESLMEDIDSRIDSLAERMLGVGHDGERNNLIVALLRELVTADDPEEVAFRQTFAALFLRDIRDNVAAALDALNDGYQDDVDYWGSKECWTQLHRLVAATQIYTDQVQAGEVLPPEE